MKAKYIFGIIAFTASLTACTNYFDEHFLDNGHQPVVDVRSGMTYELTDDDYKMVTTYKENIEKALALDPVDSTGLQELLNIAKEKSFTETASADMYVPALLGEKFPYLDNGTTCDVSYTMREGKSDRVNEFIGAQGFHLRLALSAFCVQAGSLGVTGLPLGHHYYGGQCHHHQRKDSFHNYMRLMVDN